ncbi:Lrp/AsnC family transcriptional regulator [Salinibacterium sp. ZJ70]|uniref:Lrp/AsnC family transcriptional regulator n=1 Tax=Salinibacterium sp. ZJ70 TaxID=2708084 RepID=UPI001CD61D7E|nr:Lrp/AsnC family transcriptional regulator [Salinibacterium sp. ZJ70]
MTSQIILDATDARILAALDDDPHATVLGLSRSLGLARNTVHARLRRLESGDALGPVTRRVRPSALGYPLVAFIEIEISQGTMRDAYSAIGAIPEVVEAHATTGGADLLIKVLARDTADLHRLTNMLLDIPGVQRTNTAVSLDEVIPPRLAPLLDRLSE